MGSRIYADRVKETTSTTGTSADITLDGPDAGYRSFASVMAIGDTCFYCEENGILGQWETGIATLVNATTLRKAAIVSNEGNYLCTFVGGVKSIFLTQTSKAFFDISIKQYRVYLAQNEFTTVTGTSILGVYEAFGSNAATLIPTMTSNTAPSGTASKYADTAESVPNPAWMAFDGNNSTSCLIDAYAAGYLCWLRYSFTSAKSIRRYALRCISTATTGYGNPKTWKIQGSVDGNTWVTVHNQTTPIDGAMWGVQNYRSFTLDASVTYQHYRIYMSSAAELNTNGRGGFCNIYAFELYEMPTIRLLTPGVDYSVVRDSSAYGEQQSIITRLKTGLTTEMLVDYI